MLMMHCLCIAQKSTINQTNRIFSNPEIYFKSSEEMNDIFKDIPELLKIIFYSKEM